MGYKVQLKDVPLLELRNSDLVVDVKYDNEMIGSLRISKGNVVWRPANYSFGYWLNWSDFGRVLEDKGRRRMVNF
jgi:hypothetical protein